MITFQVVLTGNQIRTLRECVQQEDFLSALGLRSDEWKEVRRVAGEQAEEEYLHIGGYNTHFIPGIRALCREGLMVQLEPTGHRVTDKGRLVLKLVEMDVQDFAQTLKPPAEKVDKPAKGKRKAVPA